MAQVGGSYLMLFMFSFNNQPSIFLKKHFQASDCRSHVSKSAISPLTFSKQIITSHISFQTTYFSASQLFEHLASEKDFAHAEESTTREKKKGRKQSLFMALIWEDGQQGKTKKIMRISWDHYDSCLSKMQLCKTW